MATSNDPQLQRLAIAGNEALDRYEKGEAGYQWLVSQLKAVVSAAEPIADAKWGEALRQAWGRLEIVNAVMYSEKRRVPTEDEQLVITSAIGSLRELLKSQGARGPSQD
jgi:hypothetical protein